ncbi:MAG: hypothetical protein JXA61_04590 [Bacteroidales bacterium]|nr:hypothetical protein [Bacteroidales bacterium]
MHKFILLILLMVVSSEAALYPQSERFGADSMKCLGSLSVMSEFAKMDLYDEAYDSWRYCFSNCPASSRNIYVIGASILKYKIENNSHPVFRNNYIDTLMLIYDRRIEYFGQEGYVSGRKGLDLLKYRPSEQRSAYELFQKSVTLDERKAEGTVLGNLMQVSAALYRDNAITVQEMMDNYFMTINFLIGNETVQPDQYPSVVETINNILVESGAADCELLEKHLLPKLQEHSHNVELLKSIVSLANKTGCNGSDLNLTASGLLFNAEPSAEMGLYLANSLLTSGDYAGANTYYYKAIELEKDNVRKAGIYCQMSLVAQQQNKFPEARDLAMSALDINPGMGEATIAIGLAYAASGSTCGSSPFERASIYWVAVDKFTEAKTEDPSVAAKADELIRHYTQFFPDNETAFFNGYQDGDEYTVGCWINETTEVRTRKIQ